MMNCIIVDDDRFVRRIIEYFVNKTKSLVLLHSFSSALDAIDLFKSNETVDLIFLDIEMPGMSGIDFLDELDTQPQIIIVSSREKYAINAFEYNVTDYLLKPFTLDRFYKAVNKATELHEKNKLFAKTGEIFIKHHFMSVKLKYADILWIEAMENYVMVNTDSEKHMLHFTMRAIEEKLPSNQFIRVHRSFIVNINCIQKIEDSRIHIITNGMVDNSIPIGRLYKDKLLKTINTNLLK